MDAKKIKSAENFLKTLQNPSVTINLLLERIDIEIVQVIANYTDMIFGIKEISKTNYKELLACSMMLGYLLKSHVDRFEINERLKNENENP